MHDPVYSTSLAIHQFYHLNARFALKLTEKLAKTTTETELIGMSIAATIGVRFPCTANDSPITL